MSRRGGWLAAAAAVGASALCLSCAGPASNAAPESLEPPPARNVVPFDIAVCAPKMPSLPEPARADALNGWLLSADPALRECLVNPAHRGGASSTRVEVETRLDARGAKHAARGENLTPAGQACIEQALSKLRAPEALPPEAPPITAKRALAHDVTRDGSVEYGIDPASDAAGRLRLALPAACACFKAWAERAPPALEATVVMDPAKRTPDLQFDLTNDSTSDDVATCLRTEVARRTKVAGNAPPSFRYTFEFLNSAVTEPLLRGSLRLRVQHLEAVRRRRLATTMVRWATRDSAAQQHEQLRQEPPRRRAPDEARARLRESCATLVLADDRLLDALGELVDTESELESLADEMKSEDAKKAAAQRRAETSKELSQARTSRAKDAKVCQGDAEASIRASRR